MTNMNFHVQYGSIMSCIIPMLSWSSCKKFSWSSGGATTDMPSRKWIQDTFGIFDILYVTVSYLQDSFAIQYSDNGSNNRTKEEAVIFHWTSQIAMVYDPPPLSLPRPVLFFPLFLSFLHIPLILCSLKAVSSRFLKKAASAWMVV